MKTLRVTLSVVWCIGWVIAGGSYSAGPASTGYSAPIQGGSYGIGPQYGFGPAPVQGTSYGTASVAVQGGSYGAAPPVQPAYQPVAAPIPSGAYAPQQTPVGAAPSATAQYSPAPQYTGAAQVVSGGSQGQVGGGAATSAAVAGFQDGLDFNPKLLQGSQRGWPGIKARINQRTFEVANSMIGGILSEEVKKARLPPISRCIAQVNGCLEIYNLYVSRYRCPRRVVLHPSPPNRIVLEIRSVDIGITGNLGGQAVILSPISLAGIIQLNVHRASIKVELSIERGPQGIYLNVVSCNARAAYADAYMENAGLLGNLVNTNFRSKLGKMVRKMIPGQVCGMLPQLVQEKINSKIGSLLPTSIPIAPVVPVLFNALGIDMNAPTVEYCTANCPNFATTPAPEDEDEDEDFDEEEDSAKETTSDDEEEEDEETTTQAEEDLGDEDDEGTEVEGTIETTTSTAIFHAGTEVEPASAQPEVGADYDALNEEQEYPEDEEVLRRKVRAEGGTSRRRKVHGVQTVQNTVRVGKRSRRVRRQVSRHLPPGAHGKVIERTRRQYSIGSYQQIPAGPVLQPAPVPNAPVLPPGYSQPIPAAPYQPRPAPVPQPYQPQAPPQVYQPQPQPQAYQQPQATPAQYQQLAVQAPQYQAQYQQVVGGGAVGGNVATQANDVCSKCPKGTGDPAGMLRGALKQLDMNKLNDLALSVQLVDLQTTNTDATIGLNGEISPNGQGGAPFGAFPLNFPAPYDNHMVELLASDFVINSLFYQLHRKQFIAISIPRSTPGIGALLKTTCSDEDYDDEEIDSDIQLESDESEESRRRRRHQKARGKRQDGDILASAAELGFCLGTMMPTVQEQHPKMNLSLFVHTARAPSVLISTSNGSAIEVNIVMDADIFLDGTQQKLGTLEVTLTLLAHVQLAGGRVTGNVEVTEFKLRDKTGSLGSKQETLDNLSGIVQGGLPGLFNPPLQKGLELKLPESALAALPFTLIGTPDIRIVEHGIYVAADVNVNPSSLGINVPTGGC